MLLASLAPTSAGAQPGSRPPMEPVEPSRVVTLTYGNRPITMLRARLLGRYPADRAESARRILDDLVARRTIAPIATRMDYGAAVVSVGSRDVLAITTADLDTLAEETLEARGKAAVANLRLALDEAVEARTPRDLAIAIAGSIAATLLSIVILAMVGRFRRRVEARLATVTERQLGRLPGASHAILPRHRLVGAVRHVVTAGVGVVAVLVAYWWLTFVLRRFPYTRPAGESLRAFFFSQVSALGARIGEAMPGLFTVALIFLLARLAVKISNSVFDSIIAGRIHATQVYVDTAVPTKRLVATLIWIFALIEAYPFLPGSGSDAFKGVSVLIGLMVSLGSAGIVNQVISSFTLTYSRALRPGDFVRIGEVEGTVTHVGVLSTKIKTPRREEVTIPNAVVVADRTTNYSRFADAEGVYVATSVTIGYDAPWRQVEALLLMAASRTSGIRREPRPLVQQTALEDFAVRYTLLVSLERADCRAPVLTELHENIQDAFNEFGVQIMSPSYEADPEHPKTVPRDRWFAAPASIGEKRATGT